MMKKKQGISYYTLTEEIIRRRLSPHSIPLECVKCGLDLKIGDRIVRRRRLLYHEKCYENTFIDIPDEVLNQEDLDYIEHGEYSEITSSSTLTVPSISTIPTTINLNSNI
jgi:hypothetical protein